MCDDLAGVGAVLCAPCLEIEQGRHAISPVPSADPPNSSPDPLNSSTDLNRELLSRTPTWSHGIDYDDEWDNDNELFKSQIQHIIDSNDLHILEILEGWERIDCPACGSQIEFEREGDGTFCTCEECRVGALL